MATGRGLRGRARVGCQTRSASGKRGQTTPAKAEGAARCVAYEARGYKQAGQTDGRGDVQADGHGTTNTSKSASL